MQASVDPREVQLVPWSDRVHQIPGQHLAEEGRIPRSLERNLLGGGKSPKSRSPANPLHFGFCQSSKLHRPHCDCTGKPSSQRLVLRIEKEGLELKFSPSLPRQIPPTSKPLLWLLFPNVSHIAKYKRMVSKRFAPRTSCRRREPPAAPQTRHSRHFARARHLASIDGAGALLATNGT